MRFNISFLFFCVIIFPINCLLGQSNIPQSKLDSARYFYYKALNPKTPDETYSAYTYYEKQVELNLDKKDTIAAIQNLRMLAVIQFDIGSYYESEDSVVKALTLLEKQKLNEITKDAINGLYIQLGRIYKGLNNYNKALEFYDEALKYSLTLEDSLNSLNNKANIHREQLKYDLAIKELTEVYNKRKLLPNELKLARALDNLGYVQSKINLPEGLQNMLDALEMRIKLNNTKGIYTSYLHLANYYLNINNIEEATNYAKKCSELAKTINSASYLEEALSLLVLLKDDPIITEYKELTDSISKAKQLKQNKFASMKYARDKEIKKTEAVKIQREKEKRLKLIYLSLAIATFLLFVASYFVFNARKKKIKIEQNYKTEAQISKKIHDELANEMYQVMTKIQGTSNNQNDILDSIEEIYHKTRNISKNYASLDLQTDFEKTLNDLLMSYKSNEVAIFKRNIAIINWEKVSEIKKMTVYRVLQELMTNMKKHSKASHVAITFNKKNKKIIIEYKDNGVGGILKKKNGLTNTESRMESIGGTISFETELNKGFKTIMII